MWEQEFGADGGALGRTVRINGVPFTVIGVAPASFTGMNRFVRFDFFVPLMMSPRVIADAKAASLDARDVRNLKLKGRLKPGVSQAQAQSELTTMAGDLERAYPETNKNRQFFVKTEARGGGAAAGTGTMSTDAPRANPRSFCGGSSAQCLCG